MKQHRLDTYIDNDKYLSLLTSMSNSWNFKMFIYLISQNKILKYMHTCKKRSL